MFKHEAERLLTEAEQILKAMRGILPGTFTGSRSYPDWQRQCLHTQAASLRRIAEKLEKDKCQS